MWWITRVPSLWFLHDRPHDGPPSWGAV
jgi:hypothetical protein